MRSLIVVALSLTVVAVAACSGSDDADPTTTSGTAAPATTSAPPATEATSTAVTTTATTAAPTTTEAPTTTLDPTAALIADIEADLNAGEQALFAAGADPSNPDLRANLAQFLAADGLVRAMAFLDQLAADGLRSRPNPSVPNVIVVQQLTSNPDGSAQVQLCRVDAAVIYEPIGESEAIVDDRIVRTISDVLLTQAGGIWVSRGDGVILNTVEGATECE